MESNSGDNVITTNKTGTKEIGFLRRFLIIFHILFDHFLEFVLGWYWGPVKRCSPPISKEQHEIVTKSAVELAKLIKERKLKSEQVVEAYISRMRQVNPELNAIVDGPFTEAISEAIEIDRKLDNHEFSEEELKRKSFLGVPFTTKDSTAVAGKLQTLGLVSRRNTRAEEDAECVRLMKESGAIILATSNVPEVNKWIEARNMLVGQTNNPYDLRRSAGGSSGGEAALIASCCTAFGLGTDIGGSIRIPSFCCGIFGHKPSSNIVNTRGCTFRTGLEERTMVVAGPMARYATDLRPMLEVLIRPEMVEKLQLLKPVELKKLRYFYIPTNNMRQCNSISREAQMIMYSVRAHFRKITGSDVKLVEFPFLEYTSNLWRYWMTQEPANFSKLLGNGKELNPFIELFKKITGRSELCMAGIYGLVDTVLPPEREELMRIITIKLKEDLKELLQDDGVLFYHSSPRTAPFHYYPLLKYQDFHYFSIFNVVHLPATQVPMGLDANGLPMGIQVVAGEMCDRLCLSVAEELQRSFKGWVPPFRQE